MAWRQSKLSLLLPKTSLNVCESATNNQWYIHVLRISSFSRRHLMLQSRNCSSASPSFPANPCSNPPEGFCMANTSNQKRTETVSTSLRYSEINKFAAIAETWWDAEGPFKPLHAMNPTRVSFIRSALCRHFRRDPQCARPLDGLRIVDVGCGGGILSEPLARLGASVVAIDAVQKNIDVAKLHSELDPLTSQIEYYCTTAEHLVADCKKFDAVIALEVIEHVLDPLEFCKSLSALTVNDGAVILSTINRTLRAYAAAVVIAENLLQWLPKGTHDWSRFLTPEEVVLILQRFSILVEEMAGLFYNPLTGKWLHSGDLSVNFILCGRKINTEM